VTYKECKNGRLFSNEAINPQNMDSEIRKVIFSGMNYYDYDISNCNYSLLYQMYKNFKKIVEKKNELKRKSIKCNYDAYYEPVYNTLFKIPESKLSIISEYLKFKFIFRSELAEEVGIDMNTVKKILLALIMGAKLTTHPRKNSAIWKETNYDVDTYFKILNSYTLKELLSEIKIASDFIIKHSEIFKNRGVTYLKNFADKNLPIKRRKKSEKMAFLLQGLESAILEFICSQSDKITVLIFDGFISEERINLTELKENMENFFMINGFPIRVELTETELNFDLRKLNTEISKVA
jgi:hypothetical protein